MSQQEPLSPTSTADAEAPGSPIPADETAEGRAKRITGKHARDGEKPRDGDKLRGLAAAATQFLAGAGTPNKQVKLGGEDGTETDADKLEAVPVTEVDLLSDKPDIATTPAKLDASDIMRTPSSTSSKKSSRATMNPMQFVELDKFLKQFANMTTRQLRSEGHLQRLCDTLNRYAPPTKDLEQVRTRALVSLVCLHVFTSPCHCPLSLTRVFVSRAHRW